MELTHEMKQVAEILVDVNGRLMDPLEESHRLCRSVQVAVLRPGCIRVSLSEEASSECITVNVLNSHQRTTWTGKLTCLENLVIDMKNDDKYIVATTRGITRYLYRR